MYQTDIGQWAVPDIGRIEEMNSTCKINIIIEKLKPAKRFGFLFPSVENFLFNQSRQFGFSLFAGKVDLINGHFSKHYHSILFRYMYRARCVCV